MTNHIYWILDLDIREGKLDELKTVMKEMVAATSAREPGTLNYEWSISDDTRKCTIYERYSDSASAVTHLNTFMKSFAPRFMASLEPKKVVAHGHPSEDLKKILSGMGAKFMTPFGGFAR